MLRALILSAALCFGVAAPVAAQIEPAIEAEAVRIYKMLPRSSTILQNPAPAVWTSYGTAADKVVKAKSLPGGEARQFRIARKGGNAWDAALQVPNALPIEAGHVVHASFWARVSKLPKGESSVRLPTSLQKNAEPYDQVAYKEIELTREWQLVSIAGEAPMAFDAQGLVLNIQAATGKQTLEVGPVFLNTLGPGEVPSGPFEQAPLSAPAASTTSERPSASELSDLPDSVRADIAEVQSRLPAGARLMSDPRIRADAAYGGESRVVKDAGVPGGKALEVVTDKARPQSWDVGVNLPITDAVAEGDVLLLAVWAKAVEARNESQTASMQPIRIQRSGGDYASAVEGAAYLSRDWDLYFIPAKSDVAFPAGDSGITYHLGLTPQTVRIGPSYLFKLPKDTSIADLPKTRIDYAGRSEEAEWRAAAYSRIDEHRKADMTISIVDGSGLPVTNADVGIRQTAHAFSFGSFMGHRFLPPETADERKLHEIFDANFNTVTLPVYWADWGWAGPGSAEMRYRRMIDYVGERGLPWRAHTVMWPGERWMPSRLLKESDPAKRRAMVMTHVREVVTALRDAKNPPFAVDFTNEPRANRYFQENGDPTLVEDAFKLAHNIAPDLRLFVNDYGILNNGGLNTSAIEFYHDWIRDMRGRGVPVGGIGFQGHFSAGLTPPERLIEILDGFAVHGLPLHITEFDIETLDEEAQADYTRDAVLATLSVPEVESFVFWQFWEGDHWKPNAAMLRQDWTEKPAYKAWRDLVFGDLWTDTRIRTDRNGMVRLRAMQGEYVITAGGESQSLTLDKTGASLTIRMGD